MARFTIGAALALGMSVLISGCAKSDDTSNVTTTNETVIDESAGTNGADDLSSANSEDAVANAAAPGGNGP